MLTIIFSIQLLATEPFDIWKNDPKIEIESAESSQINLDENEKSLFEENQIIGRNFAERKKNYTDIDIITLISSWKNLKTASAASAPFVLDLAIACFLFRHVIIPLPIGFLL